VAPSIREESTPLIVAMLYFTGVMQLLVERINLYSGSTHTWTCGMKEHHLGFWCYTMSGTFLVLAFAVHMIHDIQEHRRNTHCSSVEQFHVPFDMDMSYTRVLHPKVLHQRTASQGRALCKSQMTSRILHHTAAAMRTHNVLQCV
jgi:hypothetical protein